jgi:cytosine/uracil/thiamine/allantoin permease
MPTVFNGAIGANLHIAFPIAARASHGYWFSYFAVISRGILAMFWFGVHTGYGGTCVSSVSCYATLNVKDFADITQDAYCYLAQLCDSSKSST